MMLSAVQFYLLFIGSSLLLTSNPSVSLPKRLKAKGFRLISTTGQTNVINIAISLRA